MPIDADAPIEPAGGSPATAGAPQVEVTVVSPSVAVPADAPTPIAAPEPAAAPVTEPTPAPAPVEAKTTEPADIPSLLEAAGTKDPEDKSKPAAEAKPAEAKPAEAAKPADAAKPVEAAAPEAAAPAAPAALEPIEYTYKLPDSLKLDDALKADMTSAFDAFRADPKTGVQALLDLHAREMQAHDTRLRAELRADQVKAFNETRQQWQKDIMSDEEIGGAGHQTAMGAIARMRDMLVPKELTAARKWDDGSPRLSQFEEFLRVTGAGDHPVFHKMLHRAARFFDEPAMPPANPMPPKDLGRKPGQGRGVLYDHPSSTKGR